MKRVHLNGPFHTVSVKNIVLDIDIFDPVACVIFAVYRIDTIDLYGFTVHIILYIYNIIS